MILPPTMKHFKLFRDPFLNDITKPQDIYFSAEHRFIREMMIDSARYGGFIAVVGGVGSGKSVMRKSVTEQLHHEGIKTIFPRIIDKAKVSPSSLVDASIMDLSDEVPKRGLEQKTRQAVNLLQARAEAGLRQVMILEEAHTIDKKAFKALKQLQELESGFERLMGVILIGQNELLLRLEEIANSDIREVSRRITMAEIQGLGDEVDGYLAHKFTLVGRKKEEIFSPDAGQAVTAKLQRRQGRRIIDKSFPLSVNNLVSRAMNAAARMGEEKVSADLIMSC